MHPKSDGILESSLYVSDLPCSVRFYEEIFGFRVISSFGERGCAMQAGARQVLLLFKKGASRAMQSPHDGDGELHIAFAIAAVPLEPLLSGPRPPSAGTGHAGCVVDLLRNAGGDRWRSVCHAARPFSV